ncbi:dTDP-4-dehydrorhamnose reductase [Bacteroidales bacterium Barb6]|nr:dTDP-4-dehydrorhamnose reductase [Bacteroidales bacterium Barb6]
MKNIAVTGANGQLGNAFRRLSPEYPQFNFFFTDADTLDIIDKEAVRSYLQANSIHLIINAAAYTAVDKAEIDEAAACRINSEAVRNLSEAAAENHCKLIHISTDYVFDGTNCRPYTETDPACPASAYGRTKLSGEAALQDNAEAVIIRTSWLYSETGNNFVRTMLRLGKERDELRVVFDQTGTPTYAGDLAKAVFAILLSVETGNFKPGIYHYSNEGVCSWYDFALKIMNLANLPCQILPVETKDYPTSAARPPYSVLNKTKIKDAYHLTIPHWEESLKAMMSRLS